MKYAPGDYVIYHKPKASTHPSPRAEEVSPAAHGDMYSYQIKKFWRVTRVPDEQTIEVTTRRGKRHHLRQDDPYLKKAGPLARLWHRHRWDPVQHAPAQ